MPGWPRRPGCPQPEREHVAIDYSGERHARFLPQGEEGDHGIATDKCIESVLDALPPDGPNRPRLNAQFPQETA
jgi:hypothetical protein